MRDRCPQSLQPDRRLRFPILVLHHAVVLNWKPAAFVSSYPDPGRVGKIERLHCCRHWRQQNHWLWVPKQTENAP
jgi:hypothetical protein